MSHDRKHVLVKIQLRVWLLITNPIKLGDFHYNIVVRDTKVLACMHNSSVSLPLASFPSFLAL